MSSSGSRTTESPIPAGKREFATTHWSLVLSAGRDSDATSRSALAELCSTYWQPLYAYARRRVTDVNEAQDLTQSFFAELLDKKYVSAADPERGRFRAFLITSFKHFLSKEWERAKAQKRGGDKQRLSLDFETADSHFRFEPAAGLTPEQLYDQQWSIALLGKIMLQLEAENVAGGKADQFRILKGFLIGDEAGTTYNDVTERLGMSESAVKKAVSRLRARYRSLLRAEIAQTVEGPGDIDDEIHKLFTSLSL